MSARDIAAIVIGGSAGALEALGEILPVLPADLPLPIVVVMHVPPRTPSYLVEVLAAKCALAVKEAEDKEPLAPGVLYVAPPNYHLLIEKQRSFALSVDDPVLFSRPAIDVLFDSAADAYGAALMAILLSGANQDGAAGMARVGARGGITIVQSPETASWPVMPDAALRLSPIDRVLSPREIGLFVASYGRGGVDVSMEAS